MKHTAVIGSPPPMRGKVLKLDPGNMELRITPAYAGKSIRYTVPVLLVQDHPRLCGEKLLIFLLQFDDVGSPPPMRGKVHAVQTCPVQCGITPAYAGKSLSAASRSRKIRDHPRLCGEKVVQPLDTSMTAGSPPPMRGKAPHQMFH